MTYPPADQWGPGAQESSGRGGQNEWQPAPQGDGTGNPGTPDPYAPTQHYPLPDASGPGYIQPDQSRPVYGESAAPSYPQPGAGDQLPPVQPPYTAPGSPDSYTPDSYTPDYAQPAYGAQPGHVQPGYAQPGFTQDPYAQNPYGQNPYGQNPYGQNPYGQNPYGQNPYPQPGYPAYGYGAPTTNGKATAALICGIASIVMTVLCGVFSLPLSIAAIVCGVMSRKEIRESGGTQQGEGMGLAGIITGSIGAVLALLLLMFVGAAVLADL